MPDYQDLKQEARAMTRSLLSQSQAFMVLDRSEQMALYKDLNDAHFQNLSEAQGLATAMTVAGDLINEERHKNSRLAKMGQTSADIAGDTVKKVDFPGFVRDLLNGVFDANLNANIRQMQAFQDLLKSATQSLSQFIKDINDDEALYKFLESNNQFELKMADKALEAQKRGGQGGQRARGRKNEPTQTPAQTPSGQTPTSAGDNLAGTSVQNQPVSASESPQKVLVDKQSGKEISLKDSSIQAKLLDAKLAMAKERRTMLRETILMGVSRLVVEKGIIRASVEFSFNAYEDTTNIDSANREKSTSGSAGFSIGGIGKIFKGASSNISHTNIQVSKASSETNMGADSSTKLTGFVEIQFKSDYFKLDNFKETFDLGAGQVAQVQPAPATAPQLQPAVPAAPAVPAVPAVPAAPV